MSNQLSMSRVRLRQQHIPAVASLMVLIELYMDYRADDGKTDYAEEL